MDPRTGRVVDGRIVLDDERDLEEGARVTVWVGDASAPVRVSNEELALIHRGRADVEAGKLVDARAFLRALREAG